MEITVYTPQSSLLKQHIECFYVLTRSETAAPTTYLTFPGIQQAVSLYANSRSVVTDDAVIIRHEQNDILESRIVGRFQKVVCVRYEGPAYEITTLFRPLAINSFLPRPLKDMARGHFPVFNPYEDFMNIMSGIYRMNSVEEQLHAMEHYWIGKYNGFRHPFLPAVLEHMYKNDLDEQLIASVCKTHGISRQTLHHHFERYLCKTPSLFRKVLRFRRTMQRYKPEKFEHELSRLSALSNYFDQSHMIRDFKSLTGYTPQNFFPRLSRLGNGEVNLLFID
ncbi:MAG: AraC family transcriptional regulator [Chitinophagaceae bacterium]|nr:AraC family transcriptional regulator [Chitinophagaceae bacterium]